MTKAGLGGWLAVVCLFACGVTQSAAGGDAGEDAADAGEGGEGADAITCSGTVAGACSAAHPSCPPSDFSAPLDSWCAEALTQGVGASRGSASCGGYSAILEGIGKDCARYYFYDARTNALAAVFAGCNGRTQCLGAADGFAIPISCIYENGVGATVLPFNLVSVCPVDAGIGDASTAD
jgi:hypothetical protein